MTDDISADIDAVQRIDAEKVTNELRINWPERSIEPHWNSTLR